MLRLRFSDVAAADAARGTRKATGTSPTAPNAAGALLHFDLQLTDESGAIVCTDKCSPLDVCLVDAHSLSPAAPAVQQSLAVNMLDGCCKQQPGQAVLHKSGVAAFSVRLPTTASGCRVWVQLRGSRVRGLPPRNRVLSPATTASAPFSHNSADATIEVPALCVFSRALHAPPGQQRRAGAGTSSSSSSSISFSSSRSAVFSPESGAADTTDAPCDWGPEAIAACDLVQIPLSPPSASSSPTGPSLRLLEDSRRIAPGFGSIVWDSALLLIWALSANPSLVRRQRVVDIGSGTGVVGLAAAALGAQHVACTDLESMLGLIRANCKLNPGVCGSGAVSCAALPWGATLEASDAAAAAAAASAAAAAGDSASPQPQGVPMGGGAATDPAGSVTQFTTTVPGPRLADCLHLPCDLILASEVAYRAELFDPLLTTLAALCRNRGAKRRGAAAATGGGGAAPKTLVLLAARRRASCVLDEFLESASANFSIWLLAGCHTNPVLETDYGAVAARLSLGGPGTRSPAGKAGRGSRAGGPAAPGSPVAAAAAGHRGLHGAAAAAVSGLDLPPAILELITNSQRLSKTGTAPLLFAMLLREP